MRKTWVAFVTSMIAGLAVGGAASARADSGFGGPAKGVDSSFVLRIDAPPAKRAARSVAKVRLVPGPGFHVNRDFPASMSVVAPTGVSVERAQQTAKDAVHLDEGGAEFDVAFTASEAGKKVFTGELKFAVCSSNSCDPKREKLSFAVDVN